MNAGIAARIAEVVAETPPALLGIVDLLLKATLLLVVGFALDLLLRRRRPLAAVTLWNALLGAIVVLPAAHLLLPKTELPARLGWLGASSAGESTAAAPIQAAPGAAALLDPTADPPSNVPGATATVSPQIVAPPGAAVLTLTLPATAYRPGAEPIPHASPPQIAGDAFVPPPALQQSVPGEHASIPTPGTVTPPLETGTHETPVAAAISAAPTAPAGALPAAWSWSPWLSVAAGVYLLGFLIAACRLAAALRAVSRLRRAGEPLADDDWQSRFRRWARHLGLNPVRVDLRTSDRVNVPLVVGLRRPTVIVPLEVARSATAVARDAVLIHELAHVARADYAWQLLLRMLQTVLWFHPLIWFAERRIHYVRERVCDACSVHGLGSAEQYADVLLEMASRLAKRCSLGLGLAVVRSSKLGERLSAIYERGGDGRYAASRTGRTFAVVAALALTALVAHAAVAQVTAPKSTLRLPTEAEATLQNFRQESATAAQQATATLRERHAQTVARLQAIQDELTRAGKLDEAVAVREQIRTLQGMNWSAVLSAPPVRFTPLVLTRSALHSTGVPWNSTVLTSEPNVPHETDPGNLSAYATRLGEQINFLVTGSTNGSLWGTDLYTHDSTLAKAAIHSGVLQAGETGLVRVTILKGPPSFHGSIRNGVQSDDWPNPNGTYSAFRVERGPESPVGAMSPSPATLSGAAPSVNITDIGSAGPGGTVRAYPDPNATTMTGGTLRLTSSNLEGTPSPVLDDPGTMAIYTQSRGRQMLFRVVGAVDGPVWGTDLYTHDSDLSAAAVHAGKLRPGELGVVSVVVENGPSKFLGSTHNDVASHDWDNSSGHYSAYRFVSVGAQPVTRVLQWSPAMGPHAPLQGGPSPTPGLHSYGPTGLTVKPAPLADPGMLCDYRGHDGRSFLFQVVGRASNAGSVWGTDIYTDDSTLASAAVHAGVLADGQEGVVKVTILPGLSSYRGSTRNGYTSYEYGPFDGSYSIAQPAVSGLPAAGGTGLVDGDAGTTAAPSGGVAVLPSTSGSNDPREAAATERLRALETKVQETNARFQAGLASLEDLLQARSARNNGLFEACRNDAQRIDLLQQMASDARELERLTALRVNRGLAMQQDAVLAQASMLQAQNRLAEFQSKGIDKAYFPRAVGLIGETADGLVEILLEPKHGVTAGRKLEVWRGGNRGEINRYLGRLEILQVAGDRAVARTVPEFRQGAIERGDYVSIQLD